MLRFTVVATMEADEQMMMGIVKIHGTRCWQSDPQLRFDTKMNLNASSSSGAGLARSRTKSSKMPGNWTQIILCRFPGVGKGALISGVIRSEKNSPMTPRMS